jgi:hypothetical protein
MMVMMMYTTTMTTCYTIRGGIRVVETLLMHFIQIFSDTWEVWHCRASQRVRTKVLNSPEKQILRVPQVWRKCCLVAVMKVIMIPIHK